MPLKKLLLLITHDLQVYKLFLYQVASVAPCFLLLQDLQFSFFL